MFDICFREKKILKAYKHLSWYSKNHLQSSSILQKTEGALTSIFSDIFESEELYELGINFPALLDNIINVRTTDCKKY